MDFKARISLLYDKKQVDKQTENVKKEIENKLQHIDFKLEFNKAGQSYINDLNKTIDKIGNKKIKINIDTTEAIASAKKLSEMLSKPMTTTGIMNKSEYDLQEGYLKELETAQSLAEKYQMSLDKIVYKNKIAFDDKHLVDMKMEYQEMINLFNKGLSIDGGLPQFKGQDLTINKMKESMAKLKFEVDKYNTALKQSNNVLEQQAKIQKAQDKEVDNALAQQTRIQKAKEKQANDALAQQAKDKKARDKEAEDILAHELKIQKARDKISKLQTTNAGFLASEKGTTASRDIEQVTEAINKYSVEATKANKIDLDKKMSSLSVSMAEAKTNTFSMSEMLTTAGKKFLSWMSVTTVVMQAIQGLQLMVRNVTELDTALVDLQKVTDLTGSSLESFVDKAFASANELGRTGVELVDATKNFAQAGYNIQEAFQLGEQALLMQNIGDGIEDVDTATEVLISTMKAYNLEASDANRINDMLNEVDILASPHSDMWAIN